MTLSPLLRSLQLCRLRLTCFQQVPQRPVPNAKLAVQLALILGLLVGLSSCALLTTKIPTTPHLLLGNPSNARADLNWPTNYLMVKPQFALSYNRDRGTPNWVSWQLNSNWLGSVERQNNFRPDPELPQDWPKISPLDYRDRRYDRGHMTPSADRTRSVEDNAATFVLTNILPQASANNRGPWGDLEAYCRQLVQQGKELYIVAGGAGQQGSIAGGKITVPDRVWKVIVVMNQPDQDIKAITAQTRVIAVDLPNDASVAGKPWQQYRTSVREIEKLTGYDLLSNVDRSIQDVIEKRVEGKKSTP